MQAVRHGVRNLSHVAETAATLGFAPKHKQCRIHIQVSSDKGLSRVLLHVTATLQKMCCAGRFEITSVMLTVRFPNLPRAMSIGCVFNSHLQSHLHIMHKRGLFVHCCGDWCD